MKGNNFFETTPYQSVQRVGDDFGKYHMLECCRNCPNNPLVNPYASGICNCVLPYMNNIIS